ncbi:DsrE family protein [Thiohalorhabdus methylotrophus]|uniref:DsrE family protein n=1 Tax=Thiohalorhabdus methylotrophus TaxID=3242694 RepID=A0ABV4TZK8_9GAMM
MEETLFLFMSASPVKSPERCATPFYMASVAAALEYRTIMALQMDAVRLFVPGTADGFAALPGGRPIIDFIRDAASAGAELYVCSGSLVAQGIDEADLIPECAGAVGAAWMIEEAGAADLVISY